MVGLLSGTLRSHPVGWLTVAGIEALDPDQFSVVCLTQNAAPDDPIARRYRTAAREWIEIDGLSDVAVTALARERRIDILIDLGGYGDAARMPACANRMAPVQVKWVGMQSHSSGMAEMDWFISDRWETWTVSSRSTVSGCCVCRMGMSAIRRRRMRLMWLHCRRWLMGTLRLGVSTIWRRLRLPRVIET